MTSTQGWLPIEIGFDAQPAIVPEAAVRWIELGSLPLAEPFFAHTVKKLRASTPPAREAETSLESMLRLADRLPAVTPAGFIFHVSRCGSTLVANGLKTAAGVTVVSESQALSPLLVPKTILPAAGGYLTARWERKRRLLVDSLLRFYAHYRTGEAERLVVKFPSINILCLPLIRSWWPTVPCVVIVRDPAEVIVPSLEGGIWMTVKPRPEASIEMFGWSGVELTAEEHCARCLGKFMESAAEAVDDNCKVVDYEDLNPKRLRDIAAFLGINLPAEPASVEKVFKVYSKDPAGKEKFQNDRELKRGLVTPAVRAAAQRWAMPAYVELRSRGSW